MTRPRSIDDDGVLTEPVLIPMTEEELARAARLLAAKVRDLRALTLQHKEEVARMKAEREALAEEIQGIAATVRGHT